MYSHEIEKLLKMKNYLINVQDYIKIVESSQVNEVDYKGSNEFNVSTNDGYSFSFKIVYNTKNNS